MNVNKALLDCYVRKKLIKKRNVRAILEECKRLNVGVREYLFSREIITETAELSALGDYYAIPATEIDMFDVDRELFDRLTYNFMKKHKVVPIKRNSDGVYIFAIGRVLDCHTVASLAARFDDGKFDFILVPPSQIDRYVDSVSAVASTSMALKDLNTERDEKSEQTADVRVSDVSEESEVINNPAVRLVDSVIREAIPYRASDIHIEPFEKSVIVRYRIDGNLQKRAEFPTEAYSAICARLKIMAGLNIAERRVPQDGRINMTVGDTEYDFRVSSLPTVYGEKFVIRILDKKSFNFTRGDLGFTDEENRIIDKMLARPHGIVLLTGPTGCGKSTTLYSFLKEINKPTVNVVTVEDPVEFTMQGINQTQVNVKANMTFAAALRSILRQDPDIIMIGEIRDEETAEIAVRSAITGHIVFSTLHTNDAPGAILRLQDMGVDNYLVADALVGVIAQRLVVRRREGLTPLRWRF